MRRNRNRLLVSAVALAAAATACGSAGSPGAPTATTTSVPSKGTYTIGVLSDITGPASSVHGSTPGGIKAGVALAARGGYTIKYVLADTQTTPAGTLAAAQMLVTQKHVLAVIANSALTFAASDYLTAHNVPVIGPAEDASEWITAKNMFSIYGALHPTWVATTVGAFFKMEGVTRLASLGYAVPTSSLASETWAASARAAGVDVAYLNSKFPLGSTDVGPTVLAMKNAGVDGLVMSVQPNTAFALITALRDQGVRLKVALIPTGYGGDLTQAGPGAVQAAQGVYFLLGFEPVEMRTAATKQFVSDLRTGGVTGEPTFAQYQGYVSMALLVEALKGTGGGVTQQTLLAALANIHDFSAAGLYGDHRLDVNDREHAVNGVDNCTWIVKLNGKVFEPVKGASPICGTQVPGVTVSS
ncbi:ABC transporter substrate-binding protein [Frankia sp. AgB1.9]|uniref:ABC transporter substrate-binding protein n=1 Tax=unclassified Frankia TaxID=2632575 RepID=UPI001933ABF6|nr:ABC transporter substrate-binding protein [Frankia sp. AgW1.1]MBL7547712.1 ABC transporter substrate-binding protein [Frankia sp. AgB1.9]MBL7622646.1 ABC transporter substrate-binding protein [Frankia sp. AgB1.8]